VSGGTGLPHPRRPPRTAASVYHRAGMFHHRCTDSVDPIAAPAHDVLPRKLAAQW